MPFILFYTLILTCLYVKLIPKFCDRCRDLSGFLERLWEERSDKGWAFEWSRRDDSCTQSSYQWHASKREIFDRTKGSFSHARRISLRNIYTYRNRWTHRIDHLLWITKSTTRRKRDRRRSMTYTDAYNSRSSDRIYDILSPPEQGIIGSDDRVWNSRKWIYKWTHWILYGGM